MTPQTPERAGAERIGRTISKYLDARGWHSDAFWTEVGAKVLAHKGFILGVYRDVEADPHHIGDRDVLLRQQKVNSCDDLTWFTEEAAYHKKAYEAAVDMIDRIAAARQPEHDPDERDAAREDVRVKEARQDEAAAMNAPRVAS